MPAADPAPADEDEPDGAGIDERRDEHVDEDEPDAIDVVHDARVELDEWRASFRMDPLER